MRDPARAAGAAGHERGDGGGGARDGQEEAAGGHQFFCCDDASKTHAELKEKGVELSEEPVDHGYGIDFGLRDPFGNDGVLSAHD